MGARFGPSVERDMETVTPPWNVVLVLNVEGTTVYNLLLQNPEGIDITGIAVIIQEKDPAPLHRIAIMQELV